jgi:ATP-binding protein involved in chromosome partitioning
MHQIVVDVDWGELDYLVVDLPPGTGDILQLLMREVVLAGVVLVVTPQDIAHLDARKALDAYRRANANVIGAVENMGPLHCPHCGENVTVFRPVSEDRSIWSQGVKKLGQIPLDPEVSELGDKGHPVLVAKPDSVYANAFRQAALRLAMELGD